MIRITTEALSRCQWGDVSCQLTLSPVESEYIPLAIYLIKDSAVWIASQFVFYKYCNIAKGSTTALKNGNDKIPNAFWFFMSYNQVSKPYDS